MPTIATAGHVDHGKSTLVEALTGTDPDRWIEEKERGLTIDLGFAWTTIDGISVGFVDVPGHERFIKNMLAGVGAVDCALLVVAADSGWMPQTEEHAAVLNLLDTPRGVIALTRTDLVDDETVEIAILEILEETEGTAMSDWPIVPVSAITGAGLDELRRHLADRLTSAPSDEPPLRMWIDRAFTIRGAGLVVTGSVAHGSVRVGDEVEVLPGGSVCRVRALHRHDSPIEAVAAGDRAAMNLVTDGSAEIGRGDHLGTPNAFGSTSRILATMRPSRMFAEIPKRGAFHMHMGTADVAVSIRRIPQTDGFVITGSAHLPAVMGDRFILRDSGRKAVVGGGRIVDPHPNSRPRPEDVRALEAVVDDLPDARADALLKIRRVAETTGIWVDSGGGTAQGAIVAGHLTLSRGEADRISSAMHTIIDRYHADYPLRPGVGRGELATRLHQPDEIIAAIVASDPSLTISEGSIRSVDFTHTISDADEMLWTRTRGELEASFAVPRMSAIDLPDELLHAILRRGDLVQIDTDLAFTEHQITRIKQSVEELNDGFTVAEFKDHLEMTRRQAVPTLEWLDRIGVTVRSGDGRVVR